VLRLLVGTRIHVLFHSPPGVLFTFPSRYLFTVGCWLVLSLTRWSSQIRPEFHVFRATRDPPQSSLAVTYRAITVYGPAFQLCSINKRICNSVPGLPPRTEVPRPHCSNAGRLSRCNGLGSSPFARRYSGSRICFPLLGLLRCFNSPACLS
jgi:hypothetical protein